MRKPLKKLVVIFAASLLSYSSFAQSPPNGILLEGPPNAIAITVLKDYIATRTESEIGMSKENGNEYHHQILNALMNPKATIAQVNQVLMRTGSRISFSRERNPAVVVTVSKPMRLNSLRKVAKQLISNGAFMAAYPSVRLTTKTPSEVSKPTTKKDPNSGGASNPAASRELRR